MKFSIANQENGTLDHGSIVNCAERLMYHILIMMRSFFRHIDTVCTGLQNQIEERRKKLNREVEGSRKELDELSATITKFEKYR